MTGGDTLHAVAGNLASGKTTARALVEAALDHIETQSGGPVFLKVYRKSALAKADAIDKVRREGGNPGRFAGIPFSLKDLFDIKGEVTTAGSRLLADAPPAKADATAIARLKAAGMIPLGRTNMTEFAYSGVGLNPHYGTPKSVWDRANARIPGGSSSGAGVSVADGTCLLGIGTDTGGSCRVPAAFNGIVGYKSSLGRVPVDGVYPLAVSFDTVGPLARSVACCAQADAIMSASGSGDITPVPAREIRLGVPRQLVCDDLDEEVGVAFEKTLGQLSSAGIKIIDFDFADLAHLPEINASGGIGAYEAYGLHRQQIEQHGDAYDQRVRTRILAGAAISDAEVAKLRDRRAAMITTAHGHWSDIDAFIMPTCPQLPRPIADLADDEDYRRINLMALRNTFVGNFLNSCAITIPANTGVAGPVGIMLMQPYGTDEQLFARAQTAESALTPLT